MNIVIASLNKTKVKAVAAVFQDCEVISKSLPSDVSDQPIGDEETRKGAINRAKHAAALAENSIGIGLEGGVMFVDHELYLCNWGALVDQHKHVFTASGARIRLPDDFQKDLLNGVELSVLIDAFTKKEDIRNHEGAIGIFTNYLVDRASMFSHVVQLLKGQMEYQQEISKGS